MRVELDAHHALLRPVALEGLEHVRVGAGVEEDPPPEPRGVKGDQRGDRVVVGLRVDAEHLAAQVQVAAAEREPVDDLGERPGERRAHQPAQHREQALRRVQQRIVHGGDHRDAIDPRRVHLRDHPLGVEHPRLEVRVTVDDQAFAWMP